MRPAHEDCAAKRSIAQNALLIRRECAMKTLTENGLTAAALARLAKTSDPRMKQIMTALIRHLHGFVRETALTPAEWKTAIEFLTAVGHITDDKRQEFILLSDTLGVSAMVDLVRHRRLGRGTDSSLLGPFYRDGAPEQPLGASIAGNTPGETIVLRGRVADARGRPLAGALLDVWQAAPNGKYDIQDEHQVGMNLRGRFRTGADGHYEFRSVKPKSYPVPDDGPVGVLLRAQGRHPYRPAHIHFIVTADGHQPLITALYIAGDAYIESDAVFGAKHSLTVGYRKGHAANGKGERAPDAIEFDFTLAAAAAERSSRQPRSERKARPSARIKPGKGQRDGRSFHL
jgi:protocatechuate 3,4-dioxygenase beta subunit